MNTNHLEDLININISICSYADSNGLGVSTFVTDCDDSKELLIYELSDMLFYIAGDLLSKNSKALELINMVLQYNDMQLSPYDAKKILKERSGLNSDKVVSLNVAVLCDSIYNNTPWIDYNNTKTTCSDILAELFTAFGKAMNLILNDYYAEWRYKQYIHTFYALKTTLENAVEASEDTDEEDNEAQDDEYEDIDGEEYEDEDDDEIDDYSVSEEDKKRAFSCLSSLRENTEIIGSTFNKLGLNVLQQSWQMSCDDSICLNCFVEIEGDVRLVDETYFTIKVVLYDAKGNIVCTETSNININDFVGYEADKIVVYDENAIFNACKARIYAVPGLH